MSAPRHIGPGNLSPISRRAFFARLGRRIAEFGALGAAVFAAGLALDAWLAIHYLRQGQFSPYKVVGFMGAALNFLGLQIAGLGLVADMLYRMRTNQDRILLLLRTQAYDDRATCTCDIGREGHD